MKEIQGNLITLAQEGHFDVIIHGCNCHCTMGAGIARQIAKHFPEAWAADLRTIPGDRSKLGTYSSAWCSDGSSSRFFYVVNAYTQFDFGGPCPLDMWALRQSLTLVAANFSNKRFGIPRIGAGLGGGNWTEIREIIEAVFTNEDLTIVSFPD